MRQRRKKILIINFQLVQFSVCFSLLIGLTNATATLGRAHTLTHTRESFNARFYMTKATIFTSQQPVKQTVNATSRRSEGEQKEIAYRLKQSGTQIDQRTEQIKKRITLANVTIIQFDLFKVTRE